MNVYISIQVCMYSKQYALYWQISVSVCYYVHQTHLMLAYKSVSLSKFNAPCEHESYLSYFSAAKDHSIYKLAKCTQPSKTQ